jgi:hypothetical protein
MQLITKIIRLLLTMIPQKRTQTIREEIAIYHTNNINQEFLQQDIPY